MSKQGYIGMNVDALVSRDGEIITLTDRRTSKQIIFDGGGLGILFNLWLEECGFSNFHMLQRDAEAYRKISTRMADRGFGQYAHAAGIARLLDQLPSPDALIDIDAWVG